MTVIPIRLVGDPVLRQPAAEVTDFDAQLRSLVTDLRETLADRGGAGLAAPQLGVGARVFVIAPQLADGGVDHLVNPLLDFPDEQEQGGPEGCLSIPGIYLDTKRRLNVVAKGFTQHGDPVQVVGEGLLSRCIQHETDHLDGVLFIDRQEAAQQQRLLATLREAAWFDAVWPGASSSGGSSSGEFSSGGSGSGGSGSGGSASGDSASGVSSSRPVVKVSPH